MLYKQIISLVVGLLLMVGAGIGIPVYNPHIDHSLYLPNGNPSFSSSIIERLSSRYWANPARTHNCQNQDGLKQQQDGIPLENSEEPSRQSNTAFATHDITGLLENTAGDPSAQPTIMTLTEDQKLQVLSTYGSYFRASPVITEIESDIVPEIPDIGHFIPPDIPQFAPSTRVEVCPRVENWETLFLAENKEGKLVQVVQFPDDGMEQWFLNEECSSSVSRVVNNVSCDVRSRLVRAIVVDRASSRITQQEIRVNSCSAHTFL